MIPKKIEEEVDTSHIILWKHIFSTSMVNGVFSIWLELKKERR
jgi:hypothetical protein